MSEMTRWWWVRHAPVPGHSGRLYPHEEVDADVSDTAAFKGLASNLPKDAVWLCSPYVRTQQTASAIIEGGLKPNEPMTLEPALVEQNFGDWAGKSYEELLEISKRDGDYHNFWLSPATTRPPNGESFLDVIKRVGERMAQVTKTLPGRDVVAVAHGGTIRAALAAALELDPDKALVFMIENLSTTRIDHMWTDDEMGIGGNWRVAFVNARPL